jgi:hypothetical protein
MAQACTVANDYKARHNMKSKGVVFRNFAAHSIFAPEASQQTVRSQRDEFKP